MARFERFEDIEAWKSGREITRSVYAATKEGEFAKDYALRDQIRRAVISITSNIAEGFERNGDKEFIQFLYIAKGSCGEVRSQLYVALDQGYIPEEMFNALKDKTEAIGRMIQGLINYLLQSEMKGSKYR